MEKKQENQKPTEKLIMDETYKQRYFRHYGDLKFYIGHGIRVINVQTKYRIKQSPWSPNYTKFFTQQKIQTKNELEKHFYKLGKNSFH